MTAADALLLTVCFPLVLVGLVCIVRVIVVDTPRQR